MNRVLKMWQDYRDRKFLDRLNRVLANNVLDSDVVTARDMFLQKIHKRCPKVKIGYWQRSLLFPPFTIDKDGYAHLDNCVKTSIIDYRYEQFPPLVDDN